MLGSGGAIPAERGFLEGLRRCATNCAAVLIFDEVMTSRMYSGSGVQSQLDPRMRPDMTTLGIYIGGGMSFGCFGGKRAIMQLFDPRQANFLRHAGTFNNNVLTMFAGRVGLEQVFTLAQAQALHARGDKLRQELQAASKGTLMKVSGLGSILCIHSTTTSAERIKSPEDIVGRSIILGDLLHLHLLKNRFYIARRGFIALSLAMNDEDLKRFIVVIKDFLEAYSELVQLTTGSAKP